MKKIIIILLLLISYMGFSQNLGIGINSTGATPDPSAGLDVDFNDKGILIPRLTTNQRDGIQNTAIGLQVYNTTINCLQIYMPLSGWRDVSCDCIAPPSSTFTFPDSVAFNSNVVFNASTSGMNYSWTFQNGTPSTSTQQSPTVVWSNIGTYVVSLTVSDNIGCNTTTTDSITIINCPPPLVLNFTNCTKTGRTGPSQGQCNSEYSGTSLDGLVTVTSGIQEWTVPFTGTYQIEVAGAGNGGGIASGLGAVVSGRVSFSQGQVLKVLVGQQSIGSYASESSGGSGGSFVTLLNNTPVVIAGGGGGGLKSTNQVLVNGTTNTAGNNDSGNLAQNNGGTSGNGGTSNGNWGGAGGGGLSGNGGVAYNSGSTITNSQGLSFISGGVGGVAGGSFGNEGGFGGGGASSWASGGGGGYSGGAGKYSPGNDERPSGGGGASFVDATATNVSTSDGQYNGSGTFNGSAVTNLNSYNSGHGYVNITLVCP